jgi:2-polyprenyl-6-hydroxyphenyl methylase/3-demethylubiquinone-9 3-methyltransferase
MQFDFGKNWSDFSQAALSKEMVSQAKKDFAALFQGIELRGRSFLDVGFGQGLSLLIAAEQGARVVGCDINPKCRQVIEANHAYFPGINQSKENLVVGSILEGDTIRVLRDNAPDGSGQYDIVHSWGVLHHTGNMKVALRNACSLVKPGGHLVIAIYNRHWTSPAWLVIKYFYNRFPFLQKLLVTLLYPVIYLAKLAVTRQNPRRQQRGMDFYFDVVDWVGGYPYEYGSVPEIHATLTAQGFLMKRTVSARVPTGCNEFIFVRTS